MILPSTDCTLLFQQRYNPGDGILRVILQKNMDMVVVGFHPFNVSVITDADVVQVLFNIVPEWPMEQCLPVFRDKYDMRHKQVLIVPSVLINIVHKPSDT